MTEPRYTEASPVIVCEDCGVIVVNREAHTRFHSILDGHATGRSIRNKELRGPFSDED